ncbi:uncharacterized protein UV8b_02117 [Ustilaginoidea virens]|uniref:GMP synthase [glutamine-hydrolyzing] n=1 Tax=Ustilaginoidea virens TaxID=1159556 RepID=A0A8E5HLY2_USTVR|nr:uncharacterized protein UV8b_02117 [Ustilaginoidea virens]QUC17876.1 hypothetical protein UV8b_02117 [Ustilaginoidea virens]
MAVGAADEAKAPHELFDTILVLDHGSQYSHLILRRLRDMGVYCEMLACDVKFANLPFKPKGIILSGGPASVYDADAPHADPAYFKQTEIPLLGICYGNQSIAWRLDPENVVRSDHREYGSAEINIHRINSHVDRLFDGLGEKMQVWNSHSDRLSRLPKGFVTICDTTSAPFSGIASLEHNVFGLQFHPEVEHTQNGAKILRNFAVNICGCLPNWTMSNFVEQEIARVRKLVGDTSQVIGAVSGGVDSTVAAQLLKTAIGSRFHAVLIDTGLLRLNESQEVKETLQKHLGINLTVVDASKRFLDALAGVTDPERKRKIIGSLFIDLFEEEALRIEKEAEKTPNAGPVRLFLQGTLYPDVIESISYKGPSATIKTHHNVGGLPARMMNGEAKLQLIEPLRELFKDEVRAMGRQLGIHDDLVMRHPFPGPGIAIRIIGEVTAERVAIARKVDNIFITEIKKAGIYSKMAQAYAGLDTNKAVGVMGDNRVYGYIVILRAIVTTDFMTGEPYEFDFALLKKISTSIVNLVDGVSRVTYDITSKPPGTIELE